MAACSTEINEERRKGEREKGSKGEKGESEAIMGWILL